MSNEIITTLHPHSDESVDLYPNVKRENIPLKSIDRNRLDDGVNSLLNSINELHPSGVNTSTNILAFTSNKGIYIGSDTGHWYYWNGTQYADGGIYQTAINYDEILNFAEQITGCSLVKNEEFTEGKVMNLDSSPVDLSSPATASLYKYVVIECSEGDEFILTGQTGGNYRIYAFLDSSYNILKNSGKPNDYNNVKLIAPAETAYLVVNVRKDLTNYLFKAKFVDIESKVENLDSIVNQDATSLFENYGNNYIYNDGTLDMSGNWNSWVYDVENIKEIVSAEAHSTSANYLMLAFYNSYTKFDNTTFISGFKFYSNQTTTQKAENIVVPDGAKVVIFSNRRATNSYHKLVVNFKDVDVKERDEIRTIKNMTTRKSFMKFGAHQGYRGIAPANTLPAYELAGLYGWDYLWLAQVRHSADGTWYIMHNETIDETTDGTGNMNDLTDEYLSTVHIDVGVNVDQYSPDELKIPTLKQAIQISKYYGMKNCYRLTNMPNAYETPEDKALWDSLLNIIHSYEEEDAIFSGSAPMFTLLRQITGENWECCLFLGSNNTADDIIDTFQNYGLSGNLSCLIRLAMLTEADTEKLHRNGIKVYAYKDVVPTQDELRACAKWGVDIFQNGFVNVIKHYKL